MKNKSLIIVVTLFAVLAAGSVRAEKNTLGITEVELTPALQKEKGSNSKLQKVQDSLVGQLTVYINRTHKFELVDRKHLKKVLEEQGFATSGNADTTKKGIAELGKLAPAKYILTTEVNEFIDYQEPPIQVRETGQVIAKRDISLSAIVTIINTTTVKIFDGIPFKISTNENHVVSQARVNEVIGLSDELLGAAASKMAEDIANKMVDVAFPRLEIRAITDKQITVKGGENAGVKKDQVWEVIKLGEDLGEDLGREERLVGKAKIVGVDQKVSRAEIIEGAENVSKGMFLRLPQTSE